MHDSQVPDYSGRDIGNWRLLRRLGVGSFGAVYEAQNQSIDKQAAVKVLHPQWAINGEVVGRFLKEASAASKAKHRGVVEFYDGGFSPDKLCYMVMELCTGQPLSRLLQQGALGPQRTAQLGARLADALFAVHRQKVVHRDLKPDNILVHHEEDEGDVPKILDFGIAKLRSGPKQTVEGQMLGTPEYMSPEQCQTLPDIDQRADVYSLGVVLFECLTGRLPFIEGNFYGYLLAHVNKEPPDPRGLRPDTPPALAGLLLRMLAKEPEGRPASMAEVRDALLRAAAPAATAVEFQGRPARLAPASTAVEAQSAAAEGPQATLPVREPAQGGLTQPAVQPAAPVATVQLSAEELLGRRAEPELERPSHRPATLPPPPGPAGLRRFALLGAAGALALALFLVAPRWFGAPFDSASLRSGRADLAEVPTKAQPTPPPPSRPQPTPPVVVAPVVVPLPQELVALEGRALSRAQITIGEFRVFAERERLRPQSGPRWPWELKVAENLPMINVSSAQAERYCQDRYRARAGRLPTAAELARVRAAVPAAPLARAEEWLHQGAAGNGKFSTSFRCAAALEETPAR